METEEVRETAAASLRALSHAFVAHDLAKDALASIAETVKELARRIDETPMRDRLALMRNRPDDSVLEGNGFEDRAVGGRSNPTSIELQVRYDNDEVVADVVLRRAFEGAPGRAHGGIVAAAFDDVTGFVIGKLQEPAFTGELTVRYLAPVPVDEAL
ncbi:MAG TPA: PaaI family thioesterase, partial [Acidimicrobiales bacterium]|nr:PaaI family thioesterase [Acidimicrobiales bacterium]